MHRVHTLEKPKKKVNVLIKSVELCVGLAHYSHTLSYCQRSISARVRPKKGASIKQLRASYEPATSAG
jgi:hypothetical protein